jgi:hypothetical protein
MRYNIYVNQKQTTKFSKISRRWRAVFAAILFGVAGLAGAFLVVGEEGDALTGADFKAGNIISDDMFYNNNSMTAPQIQAFLNDKNPNCDPNGLKQSGTWDAAKNRYLTRAESTVKAGYTVPLTCLKDFKGQAPERSVDAYCKGYKAATQTAAEMIKGIADSCGVNPQVLLVLLQKEQSLVTDEWPWPNQSQKATGFACPDDAPCNDAFGGFFMQVWMAARQYRVYRQSATFQANGWYKVGQNNQIQYNPNASCGKATVFIENQATQGLYYYTPYVPNAAALANLNGTGDSCSAYGNRNFWRLFWQWFGDPHGPVTNGTTPVPDLPEGVKIELSAVSLFELDLAAQQLARVGHDSTLAKLMEDITVSGNVSVKMTKNGQEIAKVQTGALLEFRVGEQEVASWTLSVLGDANGDGLVDIVDLVAIRKHLISAEPLAGEYLAAADIMSGDSTVDIVDLVRVRQFLVGVQGLR